MSVEPVKGCNNCRFGLRSMCPVVVSKIACVPGYRLWEAVLYTGTGAKPTVIPHNGAGITIVKEVRPEKETDPTGRSNDEPGAKVDAGKIRYSLIPISSLRWLALLWTRGAEKYSDGGWKEVPSGRERYIDALFRHLEAHRGGEFIDEDTGVPHLINVAWNALVVVWLKEHNKG